MNFNGKNLIFLGSILFFLQLINFVSINQINPEIERAQVLAAISSIIIVLTFAPIKSSALSTSSLFDNFLVSQQ